MLFKNLKNSLKYEVEENLKVKAKKLSFDEYLYEEMNFEDHKTKISLIFELILVLFYFLVTFLGPIMGSALYTIDFIQMIQTPNLTSQLQQISLQDLSIFYQVIYHLRLVFYLVTTGISTIIWVNLLREWLNKHLSENYKKTSHLSDRESYLINVIKKIKLRDQAILDDFISYSKDKHYYELKGFFSSTDLVKTFEVFEDNTFVEYFKVFLLTIWIGSTGVITNAVNGIFASIRASELIISREMELLVVWGIKIPTTVFILIGFVPLLLPVFLYRKWLRFNNFAGEVIERQEEYLNDLIIEYELQPADSNLLLIEKEKQNLNNMKNLIKMPKLLSSRVLSILIPATTAIFSLISFVFS